MPRPSVEAFLRGLLERLLAAAGGAAEPAASVGREVGAALVEAHFTNPRSLARTVSALLEVADDVAGPNLIGTGPGAARAWRQIVGAVAEGFSEALQDRALREQEQILAAAVEAQEQTRRTLLLYREQRELAEQLQRSMLSAPPEVDDLEMVVRYLPASEAAAVGGDWYDVFRQPAGPLTLVIGDVTGHNIGAAASMGQLRSLLRGIATTRPTGPAEILAGLDRSISVLQLNTVATVLLACLELTPGVDGSPAAVLRWSNAGHLPPFILSREGTVEILFDPPPDPPLGIEPDIERREATLPLAPGCTVLLYTDGLIERRPLDLDSGLELMRTTLTELAGQPLPELCNRLLDALVAGRPSDDVAIAAIRLR